MTKQSIGIALWLVWMVAACDPGPGGQSGIHPGEAPNTLGAADGTGDQADVSCLVVLRSVGRIAQGPGYVTTCDLGTSDGSCLYVWRGQVDIDAARAEDLLGVEVLFRTGQTGDQWYVAPTLPVSEGNGSVRYEFDIDRFTPAAGMSMTSLNRTTIDLIPYAIDSLGQRHFDHNRISDPFGAYHLELDNLWTVAEAPAVCRGATDGLPTYLLSYPDFEETLLDGPASAGGQLRLRYDARRLRETQSCLGSEGPASSTTVMAAWMFDGDSATVQTAEVEQYIESYGYTCQGQEPPCITQRTSEPVIDLPPDADEIQLWFYCVPGFSAGAPENWKYDSNQGQNYRLTLQADVSRPIDWAGAWELYAARSGATSALPEPYVYSGFTNMGFCFQAQVYAAGLTDQDTVVDGELQAYVESDAITCQSGGPITRARLPLVGTHVGPFGNNALYRWGVEGLINNCPRGSYRYRFVFSADGGRSFTPLADAASTDDPSSGEWRTLIYE